MAQFVVRNLEDDEEQTVIVGGLVTRVKEITTKRGDKMGFMNIRYVDRDYEVVVFPSAWDRKFFTPNRVLLVQGKRQPERGGSILLDIVGTLKVHKGDVVIERKK